MEITLSIAQRFGVTPFEIMAQDIDAVILVVNYIVESKRESADNKSIDNTLNEKEQDKSFWACL